MCKQIFITRFKNSICMHTPSHAVIRLYFRKKTIHCWITYTVYLWRSDVCQGGRYMIASSNREPICSLLISWGVKVGKVTWNWAGKLLNSSVLDVVYSETRQTSLVSSNLFRSRMTCVISRCGWLRLPVDLYIAATLYVLGVHVINVWLHSLDNGVDFCM